MRKIFAAMLLLAISFGILAGCHGAVQRETFQVPEQFDTSRDYEITFWAKNENNPTQQAIYRQAVADFQELYPNIKVKLKLYSDYGLIYREVITNLSTNKTPNVCITYPDHIATYLTSDDCVVPLDELFADEKYGLGGTELRFDSPSREEIIPEFLDECQYDNQYYAIPYMRSTEACYVNKTYVEQMGFTIPEVLTWDFLWEVSEAALQKDADGNYLINGQKTMIPVIYKSTDNMMIQMLRQKGAGYSNADGDIQIFNDTTRELLYKLFEQTEKGAFNIFKRVQYPGNFFNAGQCLFAIDSTAGATWMGPDAPRIEIAPEARADFEVLVKPVPQFDTENPQMISQGPSICVFNKDDSQEVLASWIFAQYMLTYEVQTAYAQTEGYIPVTTQAQQSEGYLDYLSRAGEDNDQYYAVKIQAAQMLLENMENTFVTPVFNGSSSLRDAAGKLINNTVDAYFEGHTVDEAFVNNMFQEVNTQCHLDEIQRGPIEKQTDLGPLPAEAIALLGGLAICWIMMGALFIRKAISTKMKKL